MPIRLVQQSVKVRRGTSSVRPPIGSPFDFTDDEIAQIEAASPDALSKVKITEARAIAAAADAAEDAGGKKATRGKKAAAAAADDDDL